MITSRLFRARHPCRFTVTLAGPERKLSGLLTDSLVMTDNLATVAHSAIDRAIGSLPLERIAGCLRHAFGLAAAARPPLHRRRRKRPEDCGHRR